MIVITKKKMTMKKKMLTAVFLGCGLLYAIIAYYIITEQNKEPQTIGINIEKPQTNRQRNTKSVTRQHQPKNLDEQDQDVQRKPKEKKFWRYDDAGPKILRSNTHYLSSIPQKHRLTLSLPADDEKEYVTDDLIASFYKDIQVTYASNPDNVYPKKLHLYEYNPSITKLPEHYRTNSDWRREFGEGNLPYYVSSYRVTHWNGCYDTNTTGILMGETGSWKNIQGLLTEYLGISVMDENLNILLDTTVDVGPTGLFLKDYNDYRLFNLGEELYLSTMFHIVPVHLSLSATKDGTKNGPKIPDTFQEIPPAFGTNESYISTLRLWARNFTSCPKGGIIWKLDTRKGIPEKFEDRIWSTSKSKNLLYFGANVANTTGTAKAMLYPRFNPNTVQSVNLTKECEMSLPKEWNETYYDSIFPSPKPGAIQPRPAFETIEAEKYPGRNDFFLHDRGSACCATIKAGSIFPPTSIQNTTIEKFDLKVDEELLVAVVHPKTKFPGRSLPKGVIKNTYLSRFVAVLPREPYTILAKSGMFCLGYSREDEKSGKNPLESVKMNRLRFADEPYECPRLHFVAGIVDAAPSSSETETEKSKSGGSVIVSYGVSDCMSRFVEIPKTEIIRMLSSDD